MIEKMRAHHESGYHHSWLWYISCKKIKHLCQYHPPIFEPGQETTRYDANWTEQPQQMARDLKFEELEELYYVCSKNQGADISCTLNVQALVLLMQKGRLSHDEAHMLEISVNIYKPRHDKTGILPMRKQRRRSASL